MPAGGRFRPPVPATREPGLGAVDPRREHGTPGVPKESSPPRATTVRPSPWPTNWACARSRRTATAALGMLYAMAGQAGCRPALQLATAVDSLCQSMAMTFWLPQTEAAGAQVERAHGL